MTSLLVLAALIVLTVAGSVLPRRAKEQSPGFPWFWVVFPITTFAVALTVYSFLPVAPLGIDSGPSPYVPLSELPEDPFESLWKGQILWAVTAVAGIGLSLWAWRRGRI